MGTLQDVLWWTLATVEPWIQKTQLRKKALVEVMRHVHFEVTILPALVFHQQLRPLQQRITS